MKLPIALLSFALAGTMMAQATTSPPPQENNHPSAQTTPNRPAARNHMLVQRLTKKLNLTADQQAKVKAIFADSRTQTKALAPQLREERTELKAAVRSDSQTKIDRIIQQNAQVNSKAEAIHVKAMAKVYAILTPAQRTTFDQMRSNRLTSGTHPNSPAHS